MGLAATELDYYLTKMPSRHLSRSMLQFLVTPRFEIFYALRALDEGTDLTRDWKRVTKRLLPKNFSTAAGHVAPRPIMWPLLADTLRNGKPDLAFGEMIGVIESLDDQAFQRAILSGVFRRPGIVSDLIEGRQSLRDAVDAENERGNSLLTLIGLYPFQRSSGVTDAFSRIVSATAEYRADLSNVLTTFWDSAFSDSWKSLEPRMEQHVESMRHALRSSSLAAFARDVGLPVVFDDRKKIISTKRGEPLFPYQELRGIHVIPSAFNEARFWGAYTDAAGTCRLYFPVFNSELLETRTLHSEQVSTDSTMAAPDPALVFRALGDTTRYAMACVLARSPRTSVDLAKEFGVSKATISHHVQMLRSAGLLREQPTDRGIALALNRESLEHLSGSAMREMFGKAPIIRRSRHEATTRTRVTKRDETAQSSSGRTE